jgi:hypothetical protein
MGFASASKHLSYIYVCVWRRQPVTRGSDHPPTHPSLNTQGGVHVPTPEVMVQSLLMANEPLLALPMPPVLTAFDCACICWSAVTSFAQFAADSFLLFAWMIVGLLVLCAVTSVLIT